jgi:hypothetical protein
MYRASAADDWGFAQYTRTGNSVYGYFITDSLMKGEYALAIYDYDHITNQPIVETREKIKVYPNPSTGIINIEIPETYTGKCNIKVYDNLGRTIYKESFNKEQAIMIKTIVLNNQYKSNIIVELTNKKNRETKRIILE